MLLAWASNRWTRMFVIAHLSLMFVVPCCLLGSITQCVCVYLYLYCNLCYSSSMLIINLQWPWWGSCDDFTNPLKLWLFDPTLPPTCLFLYISFLIYTIFVQDVHVLIIRSWDMVHIYVFLFIFLVLVTLSILLMIVK